MTALLDPLDSQVVEDLRFALGRDIQGGRARLPDRGAAAPVLRRGHGEHGRGAQGSSAGGRRIELRRRRTERGDIANEANAAPIIRFVDLILYQAIQDRASDIHFEPFEYEFKIRYRVDGALYEMAPPPRHLALPVISRVKVMANLNIAERRLPQDGRIQRNIADRAVDLRVSTLPTQYGESVVLRVLDRSSVNLDLESLGMPTYIYDYLMRTIEKPNGIFIVTGPTGSGKTTTLYACLRKINNVESKLLTAEDPVEYDIEGLIQVPINEGIGLNVRAGAARLFAAGPGSHHGRRDARPGDGADRDPGLADGPPRFSTLHTNDSAGAVTRLIDMGVEPFLISSSLEAVLAQRLIRKICTSCRTAYEPKEEVLHADGPLARTRSATRISTTAPAATPAIIPATRAARASTNCWKSPIRFAR